MRLVVEAEDFEEAVAFYRDALGLREELSVAGEGEQRSSSWMRVGPPWNWSTRHRSDISTKSKSGGR